MKTQISIQVKNENWLSRCMSIYMTFGLFVKAKVRVYVDVESEAEMASATPIVLKARKQPYLIDVEPGEHRLFFAAKSRKAFDRFYGATIGLLFGAMGSAETAAMMMEGGADIAEKLTGSNKVQDNILQCALKEGDILKVSIKPKHNGSVKVKLL